MATVEGIEIASKVKVSINLPLCERRVLLVYLVYNYDVHSVESILGGPVRISMDLGQESEICIL